jgi:gas vesicle protein
MKFWLGLLTGLGLGILVGLLFAPQSGAATRTLLTEQSVRLRSGELSDEIRTRAREALDQGREMYSRTKGELSERYTNARSGNL